MNVEAIEADGGRILISKGGQTQGLRLRIRNACENRD